MKFNQNFKIGGNAISEHSTVFIIAEAGVNHNGDIVIAKKMIEVAAQSGANAIKFQTFRAENLVTRRAAKADYQVESTGNSETQYEMLKKLELTPDNHLELMAHCRNRNIEFLSTPFDLKSIDMLEKIGMSIFKIPSGEITNLPYLKKIGSMNKEIILSTGMANIGEIETAIDILTNAGTTKNKISVLHCNTEYPTLFRDVNLRAMLTIKNTFGVRVGYSDHTPGIEVSISAVALGAEIIEKHFTLDRNMEGPDHAASLEPDELKKMVDSIRNIELALGNGIKKPSASEAKNIEAVRKSIVAIKDIKAGEILTEENIGVKRPGKGISPMKFYEMIGKKAIKDFKQDDLIEV